MQSGASPVTKIETVSKSGRFDTRGVLIISTCHFIHAFYSSFLPPLLPLLIEKLSLSFFRAGFLSTVIQLPALLNPYVGVWVDRLNIRWFIILSPALTAICMSLIGVAPSYGVLLILLFVAGMSVSFFNVPAPVMVSKFSGDQKGRGMSFFMTGGGLARTIGPLVVVAMVSLLGLDGFYPIMIFGIASSVWLFLELRGSRFNREYRRPISLLSSFKETRHLMLPLSAILISRGFMQAAVTSFLPTFIEIQTGDLFMAGFSLTLVQGAGIIGGLTAGSLSDAFGHRRVLIFSMISASFMLLGFIWIDGWIRFIMLSFTGLTLFATWPVMLALVQEFKWSSPAAATGIYIMISFVTRSIIVIMVGLVADWFGLEVTYICCAALGLLGIPFILKLPTHGSKTQFAEITKSNLA